MGRWQRESLSLPRCSHFCLYSRDFARWYQHGPQSSKLLYSRKCTPYHTKARRGKRLNYGSRLDVGLPPTKLLLRLTEQLLHVQEMVFVEATFPSKALGTVQDKHIYYVTNCSTEVGEHPILFFKCSLWKTVREQQTPSLVPAESMLEVTPLVCV